MPSCLISIGANLGDRKRAVRGALQRFNQHPHVQLVASSRLYITKPAGGPLHQPDFLNAAAQLNTSLPPEALLAFLQSIEIEFGRTREQRWEARRLDLDLLLYDSLVSTTASLSLPHPRMAFRRFVLAPAVEIAADMVHPTTGWTIRRLLEHLDHAANYVAITGVCESVKRKLARSIAAALEVELLLDPAGGLGSAREDDQAGLELDVQLESLRLRARMLQECLQQRSADDVCYVGDYWFGESLVYARLTLAKPDFDGLSSTVNELSSTVIRPKLLVFLDNSVPPAQIPNQADLSERYHRELSHQIQRSSEAPILTVPSADLAWASAEVIAAIQAMKSQES